MSLDEFKKNVLLKAEASHLPIETVGFDPQEDFAVLDEDDPMGLGTEPTLPGEDEPI